MKILIMSNLYSYALKQFEDIYSYEDSYEENKDKIRRKFLSYFSTGYVAAFKRAGIEADFMIVNSYSLMKSWANENSISCEDMSLNDLLTEMVRQYNPDILWYCDSDYERLMKIKEKCHNIKLYIGWIGSAVPENKIYAEFDILFSCAQESVDYFIQNGLNAIQLHHAFPREAIEEFMGSRAITSDIVFIGSTVRSNQYHIEREKILLELSIFLNLNIYSPNYYIGVKDILKYVIKKTIWNINEVIPVFENLFINRSIPKLPVNLKLRKNMKPPIFGLDMFRILNNAAIGLNIHADSSPRYSSNMRMWEATGLGSCLLTEHKLNTADLFDIYNEIVVYENIEDCIEKARYLINHAKQREQIARNGQKRCAADHTYDHRVPIVLEHIKKAL